MYIYNVTVNIAEEAEKQWLAWMRKTHIPEMLNTGKFYKAKLVKVLVEEDLGGVTYSVQYTAKSKELVEKYYMEDASGLREKAMSLFSNKFVAFRTELQVIEEFSNKLT